MLNTVRAYNKRQIMMDLIYMIMLLLDVGSTMKIFSAAAA
jgi:hypothetical protein